MRSAKKSLVQLRSLKKGGVRLVLSVKISADAAREVEAILATSTMRANTHNLIEWNQGSAKLLH
jgi:hypothetical protein